MCMCIISKLLLYVQPSSVCVWCDYMHACLCVYTVHLKSIEKIFVTFINMLSHYVRFEVFTAVTMKNDVFWDVTPCGSCKNRRFGET
jgi:hypothetical protein